MGRAGVKTNDNEQLSLVSESADFERFRWISG
jgi:hypothetical protein